MDTDIENYLASLPRHIPFPAILDSSEICNELLMFIFFLSASGMQFLHIYRTVWWTPDSHKNQTINYYLIEPYLVIFTVVILSRRLLYCVVIKCLDLIFSRKRTRTYKLVAKYTFATVIFSVLGMCAVHLYSKRGWTMIGVLTYPFLLYFLVFGLEIEPFFRSSCEVDGLFYTSIPMHCCYINAGKIRDEVERFKNDFNNRIKHIIFTSLVNAYYGCYVPCLFAQKFIYYNTYWTTQHILFVWLGGLAIGVQFYFSATYGDVLHRSALHLGMWARVDPTDTSDLQTAAWSKLIAYGDTCIVRYAGDLYESFGIVTSAIPGNLTHSRFYKLFNNPSVFFFILTGAQMAQVVLQLTILFFATEWYHVLSLSFLALTNHYTLFKLFRAYLLTKTMYAAELAGHEKHGQYH